MTFLSREDAGRQLAEELLERHLQVDLVLGLPRGGVVVAAEVAQALHKPLDVLVVRKLGHPRHREYAIGAIAEGGVVLLHQDAIEGSFVRKSELDEVIAEEKQRLDDYRSKFHRTPSYLKGRRIVLVDDGIATGATTEVAVKAARQLGAREITVAAPVASTSAAHRLRQVADKVIALLIDPGFMAVGQYYDVFDQTTDEEVLALLHAPTV
jgi:putative phosphoribosyl transferase